MNNRLQQSQWSHFLLGAMALSASLWFARADYPSEIISRGPIAYYQFNETIATSGTAVNAGSLGATGDGAYGSHVAHPTSGALPSQSGNGGASFFNSAEAANIPASAVTVPYLAELNVGGPFTFEFWAKPTDSGSRCAAGSIVLGNSGWIFYQNAIVAGKWTFRTISSAGANQNVSGGTITPGQWQHIVGVWDGTQNVLYVNGVQAAVIPATTFKPNTTLQLGIGNRSAMDYTPFAGSLDEVAYYTNALSAERILSHYQAGTNPTPATPYNTEVGNDAPVGYWRLNDGTMASNSGTRGLAATGGYVGSAATDAGPRPEQQSGFGVGNNAVSINSASLSWVGLGNSASLSGTTDFTVSAWVKTISTEAGLIVQQRDASPGGYDGQYRFFTNPDGTVHFFVYQGGFQFDIGTTTSINDGNWHQVVAVRQGENGYIYVDDDEIASGTGPLKPLNGTFQAYIGRDMRDSVHPFDGTIDEVAIFASALSQETIQSLYYTGLSDKTSFMAINGPSVSPAGIIYATTSFSITPNVAGALPLTYQWRLNGVNIGAPSSSPVYTKVNCSVADSGSYDVIVSNPFGGSVTSAAVVVNVDPTVKVSIESQPKSLVTYNNYDASFTVVAAGTPPFSYQWKHAGTNLPGATSATLSLTECGNAQLGEYSVGVANILGSATSDSVTLTFLTPSSLYEAIVTSKRPWAYWRLNEGAGTTATNIGLVSVVDSVVGAGGAATYGPDLLPFTADLKAPDFAGMESNNSVTVFPGTIATTPNPYGSIDAGTESSLSGTGDFTVTAWVKVSANPANDAVLVQQRDETGSGYVGQYRFWVRTDGRLHFFIYGRNSSGGNEGFQFEATSSATVTDGNWHLVSASRQGLSGYIHIDGIEVGSGKGTELKSLNPARKIYIGRDGRDPGFLNGLDGSMDEVAIFKRALSLIDLQEIFSIGKYASVLTPPFVTQQPAALTRYAGASATFAVVAGGSAPLSYQWRKDGINIGAATNASLTLTGITAADAGSYSCAINNALPVGAVSANAALTVITLAPETHGAKLGALGPLAYWRLNEGSNDLVALDPIGGHNGTYEGTITQGAAGPTGVPFDLTNTAYTFDGAAPSDLNCGTIGELEGYTDFSMSLWVRTAGTEVASLIAQRDSTPVGYNGAYRLTMLADGNVNLTVYRGEDGGFQFDGLTTKTSPVNDNHWHHIVAIRQGMSGFIYVDGLLAASASSSFVAALRSANRTYIGRNERDNIESFTGDLDEIALFNRALTPEEVATIAPSLKPPTLSISRSGADSVVTWSAGTLLEATSITGPWKAATGAVSPYTVPATDSTLFFKAQLP